MSDQTNQTSWIDEVQEKAEKKAAEISEILGQKVEPFIFVVEEGKDAAVGFLKVPDAKQSLKIFRLMGEDMDTGTEMIVKAQLVRKSDLQAKGFEGEASDERFMNVDGKYEYENSALNFSLLMKAANFIKFYRDVFKKK